jgi:hypothetical protein
VANKFTFDDTVRVRQDGPKSLRPGEKASVIMVFLPHDRSGHYFERFPPGVVYSIEYEDGEMTDIHEDLLLRENLVP